MAIIPGTTTVGYLTLDYSIAPDRGLTITLDAAAVAALDALVHRTDGTPRDITTSDMADSDASAVTSLRDALIAALTHYGTGA